MGVGGDQRIDHGHGTTERSPFNEKDCPYHKERPSREILEGRMGGLAQGLDTGGEGAGTNLSDSGASRELSSERVASSIPRADTDTTWLYPSPAMFHNALGKKGHQQHHNQTTISDMDVIVTIHNMVNEQTWQHILQWERAYHGDLKGVPKLKRFLGRPGSWTPKAFWRTFCMGYAPPFDRHDWWVERADGTVVRYVIDYYGGRSSTASSSSSSPSCERTPSFFIDARPALDNWHAIYARIHRVARHCIDCIRSFRSRQE